MNIPVGTYIKIIFKNGSLVEGFVDSIEEDEIILVSEDGSHAIVITSPDEVMAYKFAILPQEAAPVVAPKKAPEVRRKKEAVQEEIAQAILSPSANPNRLKRIADLKKEMNDLEREGIAQKLTSFEVTSAPSTPQYASGLEKYGLNRFPKK